MVHIDPLIESKLDDRLGKRLSDCAIVQLKQSGVKLEA